MLGARRHAPVTTSGRGGRCALDVRPPSADTRAGMRPGELVEGRFEIVRLAAAGGMGRVYQASDRLAGGAAVALKVLQGRGVHELMRFAREAQVLAGLRHPGVVRYVAHGATEDGDPYLVMEWLEGETLSERLQRSGLGVAESIALARRIAGALGAVHRAGVVHRDLKPSNVLLPGRAVERALLIDFGIALAWGAGPRLTRSGAMMGTPGYMAPEQARGEPDVDARADVFALGCVLFKCLTGRDAFTGNDALTVLLKVVLEDPPRAGALREGLPADLDDMLARWMAKDRDARPSDGDAAAADLASLGAGAASAGEGVPAAPVAAREITLHERRLLCLLVVRDSSAPDLPAGASLERDGAGCAKALRAAAKRHRGRVEALGEDALAVVFTGASAPTDLAACAARCALSIRAALADAPAALVTGRAELEEHLPVGELIDRAVHLLARGHDGGAPAGARAPIHLDDVTAGLVGARFELTPAGDRVALVRELDLSEPPQVLLGRPTACVGRDRDIALLSTAFEAVVEDGAAGAVLVTGAPGVGKSRLRHELVRRLRERGEPFDHWIAHGDPMSAGSAFGLLGAAVRSALGLREGDPVEAHRRAIQRRTARMEDGDRVAAFLGELAGAPFPDDHGAQIRSARRDPVLMGDQVRRAAEDLARAVCTERPLLLVLEDLQWGDLPTVTFVDAALRNLADLPLFVLALARPEVHETFSRLWAGRPVQTLQLAELPRRAAERLVKQSLGEATPPDQLQAVVERAGGNAFYLEELIRAVAAGRGAALPETVLAMAQARIEGFDAEARRVLRAASIFGRTFTQAGVEALLGGTPVGHRLEDLVEAEVIVRRTGHDGGHPQTPGHLDPRPPHPQAPGDGAGGGGELGFRHALMQEAAYGMLTEGDRAVGHALAGAWLEREGRGDAMALAEHFERAGRPERAVAWYRRAAAQALEGDDLGAALARAERAAASGAAGSELGAVRLIEAEVLLWRGALAEGEERADQAATLLAPGTDAWYRAISCAALAASKLGALDRVEARAAAAVAAPLVEAKLSARVQCLIILVAAFTLCGLYPAADALLARARAEAGDPPAIDASALGRFHQAQAFLAGCAGDLGGSLIGLAAALEAFDQAGDRRTACAARANLGFVLTELGDFARAEEALRAALRDAGRMGLDEVAGSVLHNLGNAVAQAGRLDEARRLEEQARAHFRRHGSTRMEGCSGTYLAQIALLSGDPADAEQRARAAAEQLAVAPPLRALAMAVLARALLQQGRAPEALAAAEEAFAVLEASGGALEEGESLVRLVHAEALAAAGRRAEALAALAAAKARLLERADAIRDPAWRESFLANVPENARTLALGVEWNGRQAREGE
jgi:tetratricopeptide (TPR) repeat protein